MVERYREREKRADRRAGGVMAALYNLQTRAQETDPILDWDDFFTEWKGPPKEQTEEEMYEKMLQFAAMTQHLPRD